jgi:outer membrane protein
LIDCREINSTGIDPNKAKENIMKKILIAAAVGMLVAGSAAAQESSWLVRARAVNVNMTNEVTSASLATVGANDKTIGEVDVTYFFNKNVAAELILTLPQKQVVSAGATSLGTFKHLPPTLTLQYHFTDFQSFKPYLGAGINYTKITGDNNLTLGSTALHLDDQSFGAAFQIGVDVPLTKQVSLNFDVKKVYIRSDVYTASGASLGTLKLDPVLVGVGVGYRF